MREITKQRYEYIIKHADYNVVEPIDSFQHRTWIYYKDYVIIGLHSRDESVTIESVRHSHQLRVTHDVITKIQSALRYKCQRSTWNNRLTLNDNDGNMICFEADRQFAKQFPVYRAMKLLPIGTSYTPHYDTQTSEFVPIHVMADHTAVVIYVEYSWQNIIQDILLIHLPTVRNAL